MKIQAIKAGDKLSFQWRPGYRGPLRDGETILILTMGDEDIQVRYRLNQEATVRAEHLLR